MENAKQKVLELINSDKIRHLYANTYYSLHDRLDQYGFLEESFLKGRYPGNYTRTSGAYSLMMAEFGNLDLAERPVRFLLDTMRRFHLNYVPHVVHKLSVQPNGEWVQNFQKFNQIDGTAHLMLAYATLVLDHGKDKLLKDYWDFMSDVMDANIIHPNFNMDDLGRHPSTMIRLFLNSMLEHSRGRHFWNCYDLLTQSFMGAALEKFIAIANKLGETGKAGYWQRILDQLHEGLKLNLTQEYKGKTCYAELRLHSNEGGECPDWVSWINLSPLAARWDPISPEITNNTIEHVWDVLWLPDPTSDDIHFLTDISAMDDQPLKRVLGKFLGWDMDAALRLGNYQHILEDLLFVERYNDRPLYFEMMNFVDGRWQTTDCGNGEQCTWWCTAMGHLRAALGLPMMPDRADVNIEMPKKEV